MNIGMILEDNKQYPDGKGREYYIDYVLNRSSIRQWSLARLADYGFDPQTGIWTECPGYCNVVLNDYTSFATLFDRNLNFDLVKALPSFPKPCPPPRSISSPTGCYVASVTPTRVI